MLPCREEGLRLTKALVKILLLKIAGVQKLWENLVQLEACVLCLMAEPAQQKGCQASQADAWSHRAHKAADWQAGYCVAHARIGLEAETLQRCQWR